MMCKNYMTNEISRQIIQKYHQSELKRGKEAIPSIEQQRFWFKRRDLCIFDYTTFGAFFVKVNLQRTNFTFSSEAKRLVLYLSHGVIVNKLAFQKLILSKEV